ncbi:MAG: DUF5615 family PIN-like protein [Chloroflexota bacterium]
MNFLADESVDFPVVERLRQDGHSVAYVTELGPEMADMVQRPSSGADPWSCAESSRSSSKENNWMCPSVSISRSSCSMSAPGM